MSLLIGSIPNFLTFAPPNMVFSNRLNQFGQRLDAFDARFDQIDKFHTTLQTNWDATHGHWNVPGAAFDPSVLTPEDDQAGEHQDDMDED